MGGLLHPPHEHARARDRTSVGGEFAEAGQRERRLLLTLTQVERRGLLVHSLVRAVLMNRTLRLLVLAHSGIE